MSKRTLYIAIDVSFWREGVATAQVPGSRGTAQFRFSTRSFTNAPHSLGYAPVYDSIDKLREDFPDAGFITVEGQWKNYSVPGSAMTLESPMQNHCKGSEELPENPESTNGPG